MADLRTSFPAAGSAAFKPDGLPFWRGGARQLVPPAFDAIGAGFTSLNSSTPAWSHTVSGLDRILLAAIARNGNDTRDVTAVSFGAQAFTEIPEINNFSSCLSVWYLVGPNIGTATISATLNAGAKVACNSISLTGVNQSSPFGTQVQNTTGNALATSVNLASEPTELCVDFFSYGDGSQTPAPDAGQTQRFLEQAGVGTSDASVGCSTEPGDSAVAIGWSVASAIQRWTQLGIPVRPA